MQREQLSLDRTNYFDQVVLDYLEGAEQLAPFCHQPPRLEAMEPIIGEVEDQFPKDQRQQLADILKSQYEELPTTKKVEKNIASLADPKTVTVTTGHQPVILTGPLYFIYKIVSAINAARQLSEKYPGHHFVPVYWMGGEDHDFEEISTTHLFNKAVKWENDESGPVGRMSTESMQPTLQRVKEILGDSDRAAEIYALFEQAYTEQETLAEATRWLVNALFQEEGLVVINPDDARLKQLFLPVLEKELFAPKSHDLVQQTIQKLEQVYQNGHYKPQANPREINLFYLKDDLRERIVQENGKLSVLNQKKAFSKEALKKELHDHPERFSPNVILRPIYQQTILPNIAYIGGGAEVSYWLELKSVFDHYDITYPVVLLRNSALWIDKVSKKRMNKLNISTTQLFEDVEDIVQLYMKQVMEEDEPLQEELRELEGLFEQITLKAAESDKSLKGYVQARQKKVEKMIENIEDRIVKAEKDKKETAINQIYKLKEKLFPQNNLQERVENFSSFYLIYGPAFFDQLKKNFDPFDHRFTIFEPELE